jgi:predicted aspartyl protease
MPRTVSRLAPLVSLWLWCAMGCQQVPSSPPARPEAKAAANANTEILALPDGHYYVIAFVNGGAALLAIDTGLSTTLLDSRFAEEVHVKTGRGAGAAVGLVTAQPTWTAEIDEFAVAGRTLRNVTVSATLVRNHFEPPPGSGLPRFGGLIGMDLLRQLGAKIDLARRTLVFAPAPSATAASR